MTDPEITTSRNADDALSIASFTLLHGSTANAPRRVDAGNSHSVHSDALPGLQLLFETRSDTDAAALRARLAAGRVRLLVGDASELERFDTAIAYTNLVQVEIDVARRSVVLQGSLVGLPPVFLLRAGADYALSTPLPPPASLGMDLGGLDLEACADLLRWGHPIDGRTMARNVRVVAAGARVEVAAGEVRVAARPFEPDAALASLSREALLRAMCDEFAANAARLQAQGAVVSLSGGLDSRAAAVAMLKAGQQVSFATLAVSDRSLDAQLARTFCASYGAPHRLVLLDERFLEGLPARLDRTAALTYGVAVLNQSIDVFMYEQLGPRSGLRVTGNLGNQVGRGGVESTAAYLPSEAALSAPLRAALAQRPVQPWYLERMNRDGFAHVLFQQEVSWWSVPNYSVGARHAVQQCPYASRRLIALADALYRINPELRDLDVATMRARDLRHRMRGTPLEWSFQRQFLVESDVRGRDVPINWGWLARGGRSPRWVFAAMQAAADAAAVKWSSGRGWRRLVGQAIPTALRRPYGLIEWPQVVLGPLREYFNDTLRSAAVAQSGAFDAAALEAQLDGHFSGTKPDHSAVVRAFEIASACRVLRN